MDLRRATVAVAGRFRRRVDVAVTGGDGLRSRRRRRRPGDLVDGRQPTPGGGVDGAGLEVGAAVPPPTTAGRRRRSGRTSPVVDALRLRFVRWTHTQILT